MATVEQHHTQATAQGASRGITKVLMGNHAVSWGVMLSRVKMISAYPITPQTQIVEELSEICGDGRLDAKFVEVESEHSAMACVIGASAAGVRTFTATSAQGLALMHELLHWAGLARFPVVVVDINRAMAPGWSIWSDQTDALSQRDTGLMHWYCETNQEVLDGIILGFKVAERVRLPLMLVLDAFLLSHTYEPVHVPDQSDVDCFLPPYVPKYRLDVENPAAFGALTSPEHYMELRYRQQLAMMKALEVTEEEGENFLQAFGRDYRLIECYQCDGAEVALVCAGSMTATAREVVDRMREEGIPVGLVKIRVFRPFPVEAIRKALAPMKKVAVLDRNISAGAEGIFAQEVKATLCNVTRKPEVHPFIVGLGGRDITPTTIRKAVQALLERKTCQDEPTWLELKE